MAKNRILITGALGQLGKELTEKLNQYHNSENIILTDIHSQGTSDNSNHFEVLDVLNQEEINKIIERHNIGQIYHLAAVLSAKAEKNPLVAWNANMEGLVNILEAARTHDIDSIFWPSSIAVYGTNTPKVNTPQTTVMDPNTVYGISKLAGERWCAYYNEHFNMDIRSLRYPGLIGYRSMPGGGTTDYAVEIFHSAIKNESYTCYLEKDVRLPMMYMDDAVRAALELMEAGKSRLTINSGYNISGFSLTPEELYNEIKKHHPNFSIKYEPDYRQKIALSWPESIDDRQARQDWNWKPTYDIKRMTRDILDNIKVKELIS